MADNKNTYRPPTNPDERMNSVDNLPLIFEWYTNEVEDRLLLLHDNDRRDRQQLVQVMRKMEDS